jgi:hypothetical protein
VPQVQSVRAAGVAGAVVALSGTTVADINPAGCALDTLHPLLLDGAFAPFVADLENSTQIQGSAEYLFTPIQSTISLGFERYTYGVLFSDQTLSLSFAKGFDLLAEHRASVGARARYETLGFGGFYPGISSVIVDAGLQFAITAALNFGASATNLLGSHFLLPTGDREDLVRAFHAGFAYTPISSSITLLAAIESEHSQKPTGHFGSEYWIEKTIALRVGATSDPSTITTGLGIRYEHLYLDAAVLYAPLVTTLSFGIAWQ